MQTFVEHDDLFEAATGTSLPKESQLKPAHPLPPINIASNKLDELINTLIPSFTKQLVELEVMRERVQRIDGCIIGTGEADFTKGNTVYTLAYKGKVFQLIDVPGIEGDEGKYANMVHQAVVKAHMVFYINGTNKKPENATAQKIRQFLRRGTKVCPIINVRGSADAYEFEEDRTSLEAHGGAVSALKQTTDVLSSILGQDVLFPGLCVQGLLAFSSLAMNNKTGATTIHPSRSMDLVVQQRNYLKHFKSTKVMYEFSQIRAVANVLHTKLLTFKEDIIESNKTKARELLKENSISLRGVLNDYQKFIKEIEPELKKCKESICSAIESFERLVSVGRNNIWSEFFNTVSAEAHEIVAENFGDNDMITRKINKIFKEHQSVISIRLQEQFENETETLQKKMKQAMERLIQDVQRIQFQQKLNLGKDDHMVVYDATSLDMDLGLKEWGEIAFNIGTYALTGATIDRKSVV